MSKIYTYYEPIGNGRAIAENKRQIKIWETKWRSVGYDPVVLGITDVKENSVLVSTYLEKVAKFPCVTTPEYEMACWRRWLAYPNNALVSDYDVLPNGPFESEAIIPFEVYGKYGICCFCHVTRQGIQRFIESAVDQFDITIEAMSALENPIWQDMHQIQSLCRREDWCCEFPYCDEYGKPRLDATHYSTRSVGEIRKSKLMGHHHVDGVIRL